MRIAIEYPIEISKGDDILIKFSSEMLKDTVEKGLMITPSFDSEIDWLDASQLKITLKENLKPDSEYRVYLSGAKTKWFIEQEGEFIAEFKSPGLPEISKVSPVNEQEGVEYNEKIIVKLNKPLLEDLKTEIAIDPLTGFRHELNQEKDEIVIIPESEMLAETEYKLLVRLADRRYPDIDKIIYQGSFKTKNLPVVIFDLDKNGNILRSEKRKEKFTPSLEKGRYIDIDISAQTMILYEDGLEKGLFKISSGKRGMDTPQGTFKIMSKSKRPWSKRYSLFMPWFIQFTNQGHGIHELPEWPGGYKEGANRLGVPVSHGCVRLGIGAAKIVYDFAVKGMSIVIHW